MKARLGVLISTFTVLGLSAGSSYAQTYVDAVLADNPVAYYRLNETSTLNPAADSANPGGNVGNYNFNFGSLGTPGPTLIGSPGNVAPNFARADVVSATSAALDVPETGSYSIELWFNPRDLSNETPPFKFGELAAKGPNGAAVPAQSWYLLYWGDQPFGFAPGAVRFGVDGSGDADKIVQSDLVDPNKLVPLDADEWFHIVGAYDATSGLASLYLNGSLAASNTLVSAGPLSPGEPLLIGGLSQGGALVNFVGGGIDEVAYYGTALSASQVKAHWDAAPEPGSVILLVVGAFWMLLIRRK